MKAKFFIIITAIIISFLFTTCEKDKNNPVCKVIHTMIIYKTDTSYTYHEYDPQNRLTKTDFGDDTYYAYIYESGKITEKYYSRGSLYYTNIYALNDKNLATSCKFYNGTETSHSKITTYEYTDDGYIEYEITRVITNADDIDETWYYYEDGNLSSKEREHATTGDVSYSETAYEYYTDKSDKAPNDLTFKGKSNKNLVKSSVRTDDAATTNSLFTYEFDNNGLISKKTSTVGTIVTYSYPTYSCN
jgi:hypothetical protein